MPVKCEDFLEAMDKGGGARHDCGVTDALRLLRLIRP